MASLGVHGRPGTPAFLFGEGALMLQSRASRLVEQPRKDDAELASHGAKSCTWLVFPPIGSLASGFGWAGHCCTWLSVVAKRAPASGCGPRDHPGTNAVSD